jgi:hypothetical protein
MCQRDNPWLDARSGCGSRPAVFKIVFCCQNSISDTAAYPYVNIISLYDKSNNSSRSKETGETII